MAKLYFRYSAMDAGKTLDLIKVAYNYKDRGQETLVLTSSIDRKAEQNKVSSRTGFDKEALSVNGDTDLFKLIQEKIINNHYACILVDEIHFFSLNQINQLSDVVDYLNIPVICYGLRSDYCGRAFVSSAQLLAIADTIEEVKTICHCGKKATFNMLIKNGIAVKEGDPFVVDNEELKNHDIWYTSVCRLHWKKGAWK